MAKGIHTFCKQIFGGENSLAIAKRIQRLTSKDHNIYHASIFFKIQVVDGGDQAGEQNSVNENENDLLSYIFGTFLFSFFGKKMQFLFRYLFIYLGLARTQTAIGIPYEQLRFTTNKEDVFNCQKWI